MLTRAELRSFLWEHVTEFAKDFTAPLVRHQCIGRELCGRDLDRLLVVTVILLRADEHPEFAALDPKEIMAGHIDPLPALPVNTLSIADSTGIPRETVRRKVAELVQLGWVCREGSMLRLTPLGWRALDPLRQSAISLFVQTTEAVEHSLEIHGMVDHRHPAPGLGH
jgi:hypothetical protein